MSHSNLVATPAKLRHARTPYWRLVSLRVVTAQRDPFPQVAGGGIQQLQAAGVQVEVGCCEAEARSLNAPYLKLVSRQQPWVIAKWAMSLDGKIATRTGHSRWISNAAARAITHRLRARVDAIVVGRRTAELDDPQLTARLPDGEIAPRIATRIVLDSQAQLSLASHLVRTSREIPVLIFAGPTAPASSVAALRAAGCEVIILPEASRREQCEAWLKHLGQRRMTNILIEGGGQLLGSLFDANLIDEAHIFIAPKLIGGESAPSPLAGLGRTHISETSMFTESTMQILDNDFYFHGRMR